MLFLLFANRLKSAFKAQNKGENHGFGFIGNLSSIVQSKLAQ